MARSLLVLGGLGAGLLIAELALRLIGYERPVFYDFDAQRGWAPRPGAMGVQRDEGEAEVRINAAGLRDRDHSLAKPPGTLRIAALGDSYTDAIQVPVEATWWRRLETVLGACPKASGRHVEVIDFGVRGYSTAQELLTWRLVARAYHPDLVVLAYSPESDLVENTPTLSAKVSLAPFFVFDGNALVQRPPTNGETWLGVPRASMYRAFFALKRHWRVAAAIDIEGLWARVRDRERVKNRFRDPDPRLEKLVTYSEDYLPPQNPELAEAWRVTEKLIATLNSEVTSEHARLVVVVGSSPIQAFPDRELRERFATRIGVPDLGESDRRLTELGARIDVPVVLLAPEFQRRADASGEYLHGFPNSGMGIGHWNEAGHRLAGDRVAAAICQLL